MKGTFKAVITSLVSLAIPLSACMSKPVSKIPVSIEYKTDSSEVLGFATAENCTITADDVTKLLHISCYAPSQELLNAIGKDIREYRERCEGFVAKTDGEPNLLKTQTALNKADIVADCAGELSSGVQYFDCKGK